MISKHLNFKLDRWNDLSIQSRFSTRNNERRIGEDVVDLSQARFVILGIAESIGPKANFGKGGAENAFDAFCTKFFAMQSTADFDAKNVSIAGCIRYEGEVVGTQKDCAKLVEELDEFVYDVLNRLLRAEQIPIVIGGGHNNALPLIRFSSNRQEKAINVINLDAHADYRPMDERHSGNPFSFAYTEGKLNHYSVLGLHKRYNSQAILDALETDRHWYSFYEDYLDTKKEFWKDIVERFDFLSSKSEIVGLELDLDTIERMPSSAYSPFGVSAEQARKYVRKFAQLNKICYFHLPEGAPTNEEAANIVGKMLAYLVADFLEVSKNK